MLAWLTAIQLPTCLNMAEIFTGKALAYKRNIYKKNEWSHKKDQVKNREANSTIDGRNWD